MIRLQNVEKSYPYKGGQTWVLRQIGIEIAEGQNDALILAVTVCIDQMSHNEAG